MKALIKDQPKVGINLVDVPEPQIKIDEVLIKVHKTGICGTDVHIYDWDSWAQSTLKLPLVIGHEFYGTIVEIGSNVSGFSIGDRVSAEGHFNCETCRICKANKKHLCPYTKALGVSTAGAFAELVAVPARNLIKLPDTITDDQAAILDPLGNAVHTTMAVPVAAETVLICGMGPIGLMCVAVAKTLGAKTIVVTDLNKKRLTMAKKLGADFGFNPQSDNLSEIMQQAQITEGFAVGLETSGAVPALNSMLEVIEPGGHIAALGILPQDPKINWNKIVLNGLTIHGIHGRRMFETWQQTLSLLEQGLHIDSIITHQFSYQEYAQAFALAKSGQAGKIIINW